MTKMYQIVLGGRSIKEMEDEINHYADLGYRLREVIHPATSSTSSYKPLFIMELQAQPIGESTAKT